MAKPNKPAVQSAALSNDAVEATKPVAEDRVSTVPVKRSIEVKTAAEVLTRVCGHGITIAKGMLQDRDEAFQQQILDIYRDGDMDKERRINELFVK